MLTSNIYEFCSGEVANGLALCVSVRLRASSFRLLDKAGAKFPGGAAFLYETIFADKSVVRIHRLGIAGLTNRLNTEVW